LKRKMGTFSIVAFDKGSGEVGVAVQSKFISVGSVVPWARAGAGAIATQAFSNASYGPKGLDLLTRGLGAKEVVRKLTAADKGRAKRQLGIVDCKGGAEAYTGPNCFDWAGHIVGESYTCQGNILVSRKTVEAMARTYETKRGDLADRMLAALHAGQKAGGDRRGQQSAAIYVAKKGGSYGGTIDRYIDVRVDDHPDPITELQRIFDLYSITLLEREDPKDRHPLKGELVSEVQNILKKQGYYKGKVDGEKNKETVAALKSYYNINNFENKWRNDGSIWGSILEYMRAQAK
jgi:uncharacterized Ntn-hydrolase superfamily protein